MSVNAAIIKDLRSKTDASLSDCLNALKLTRNNLELAIEYLLNHEKLFKKPIVDGFYAIDDYVIKLKQEALNETLLIKSEIKSPIKKIKFCALDYNNLFDYISIDNEEHGIFIDIETNILGETGGTFKDYNLMSFHFKQLEKENHEIKKPLSWSSYCELPKSIFLYETLKCIKDLPSLLKSKNILIDDNIEISIGDHNNTFVDESEFLNYSIEDAANTFNINSFNDFIKIIYKNINQDFYTNCVKNLAT